MKTQQLPVSQITEHLNDIDHTLYLVEGVIANLRALSGDMGMEQGTPTSAAFWSILNGAECFVRDGMKSSDDLHRAVKRTTIC